MLLTRDPSCPTFGKGEKRCREKAMPRRASSWSRLPPQTVSCGMMGDTTTRTKQDCSTGTCPWHVVLLVDSNERSNPCTKSMPRDELVREINHAFGATSSSSKFVVHCETRRLVAGDYMWIARKRGFPTQDDDDDVVLDCIIERKTLPDLTHALSQPSNKYWPLNRMQVQMKKLKSTTLRNKIFLLENPNPSNITQFISNQGMLRMALNFAKDIQNGDHAGFFYKETTCVNDTVRFLMDQHEWMRNRVQQAYDLAMLQSNNKEDDTVGVDMRMRSLPPFASIGIVDNLNTSISKALNDTTFQYYLALRRVPKLGESKTRIIMERFPTQQDLEQQCMMDNDSSSSAAMKTLASLDKIGKTMAHHIWNRFATRKPPPSTTQPTDCSNGRSARKKTRASHDAQVVTPDILLTAKARKRAKANESSTDSLPSAKRCLFASEQKESDSKERGLLLKTNLPSVGTTTTRRCLFGNGTASSANNVQAWLDGDDSSSDDGSLFDPIFPMTLKKSVPGNNATHSNPPNSRATIATGAIINVDDDDDHDEEETEYPPKKFIDTEIIEID